MENINREQLAQLIVKKIEKDLEGYKETYLKSKKVVNTKYLTINNLLPDEIAKNIYECFPKEISAWREFNTFREKKLTSKQFDKMPKILGEITFAIQDPRVINIIEKITGMNQLEGDPMLYAGGLSMMRTDDFLNPHIDNSHDQFREKYRRINLLYYCTPEWKLENGGNLELWDDGVRENEILTSSFNSLVLMETNRRSWHSVSKVNAKNSYRCCVSNYYFSKISPDGTPYYHVTSFQGRPEQKIRRVFCSLDNAARKVMRVLIKDGIGKKDLYIAKK